ncbi:MAG: hypothetical protein IAE77_27975 [Prosthecobacter sp.]|jgi:mannosyltransferase OCH1-like enzyme|uniref:glycosyltransferase family 32 protein n=1 Tax=Prosthecobacter sp. TaxID=1965333 RepID=UPI0019EA2DF0|nr:glycosyltransferase [Prosthecobacter sp.]MBE2287325.1 hypothetical protein [Prosthecobacter sp.]
MIPRIIHQTWKTRDIPPHLQEFQQSWRVHHPDWEYRLWTDEDNSRLIHECYPQFVDFWDRPLPPIIKIDFVRLAFMHQFGGIYVDMDFEALRPLTPLFQDSKMIVGREKGGIGMQFRGRDFLCNALIASPAGHPLWLDLMQEMIRRLRPRGKFEREPIYVLHMTLEVFDAVLEAYQQTHSDLVITSHEMFYPAPPTCRLVQARREMAAELDSYAIHHFDGSWLGWRDRCINLLLAFSQCWRKRPKKSQ